MASAATDSAYDVSGEVTLLGTIKFAVTDPTTVLADLILVVAESTVQSGELSKLVAFVVVLAFGRRGSL